MAQRKKFDRKAMAKDLDKRGKQSYNKRDDKGMFKDYFDPNKMENVSKWWAGKGTHVIDIIPYYAGENDPQTTEGKATYVLDIWVHQKVGVADDAFVCPVQFGEACPICEERKQRVDNDEDYETRIKPLKPKRRVVYNIVVRDNGKEEEKGVQLFEMAHYFMESALVKIAKDPDGGLKPFWNPDIGKRISFERTGTGATNTKYEGFALHDRKKKVTDEHLENALCLDDLIVRADYDTIKTAFCMGKPEEGGSREEEEEQEDLGEDSQECPIDGGVFGQSYDEFDECTECKLYEDCSNNDVPY